MYALGATACMIARVERDVEPLAPWEERVGVVEAKGVRWG